MKEVKESIIMNREIKFRGLNKEHNQWLYGYFFKYPNGRNVIYESDSSCWEVYSSSVGQYTGLKDKNGREIYEGDIVSSGATTGVVMYDCDQAGFVVQKEKAIELRFYLSLGIEVIGNVYDNPDGMTCKCDRN